MSANLQLCSRIDRSDHLCASSSSDMPRMFKDEDYCEYGELITNRKHTFIFTTGNVFLHTMTRALTLVTRRMSRHPDGQHREKIIGDYVYIGMQGWEAAYKKGH